MMRARASTTGPVVLHRYATGEPDRGRLLLLHGLANNSAVWQSFVGLGGAGWEIWAADLPWRGDADPAWCRHGDPLDYVDEALAAVPGGVDAIVAHSFAATLMLGWVDREGADGVARRGVRGLAFVSPFYRDDPDEFTWDTVARCQVGLQRIMEESLRVHAGGRFRAELCADMARRLCERVGPYGWLRFFQTYVGTPWLRPEMVTVPCLVVTGDGDEVALPAEGKTLADRLPHAQLRVVAGSGHFPMSERPRAFANAVDVFLAALPGAAFPSALRPDPE
jgi:pimeloyl-ACP methyl ester carboxylesterase